jgi:hypothetical protein
MKIQTETLPQLYPVPRHAMTGESPGHGPGTLASILGPRGRSG